VGLERGPLNLVSTIEELLGRKSSSSGLEIEITAVGDPPRRLCDIPLFEKVGTNFADKRRSFGLVRSRTLATEFSLVSFIIASSKLNATCECASALQPTLHQHLADWLPVY
jgi:hypothetical protein